ncbi:hypothetical protein NE235_11315 [Actinoallomurus spadix]|uniref:PD-(D/E)XK endonuclease-like domain-containing protein n=1 Tax=Actinoallomurus spadix TaxID=79912 RepID=A0ABP3GQ46_9ACTN|nr:hypothetical protein [Actinoallomurus spadix]MCO5986691.1 hypothetical protein [Actinoallomurus spadix]
MTSAPYDGNVRQFWPRRGDMEIFSNIAADVRESVHRRVAMREAGMVTRRATPTRMSGDFGYRRVRERLETIRTRSEKSSSWRSMTQYVSRLVNREGYVPVKARLAREDIVFLASARDDVIAFCEMTLRLIDLHQPRDAGGITSDIGNPMCRCRACMWRWPCPTFRAIQDAVERTPGT